MVYFLTCRWQDTYNQGPKPVRYGWIYIYKEYKKFNYQHRRQYAQQITQMYLNIIETNPACSFLSSLCKQYFVGLQAIFCESYASDAVATHTRGPDRRRESATWHADEVWHVEDHRSTPRELLHKDTSEDSAGSCCVHVRLTCSCTRVALARTCSSLVERWQGEVGGDCSSTRDWHPDRGIGRVVGGWR